MIMKICLFVDEFTAGSTPKLISYPAIELQKLGHEVCIIILYKRNTNEEKNLIKEFLIKKKIKFRFVSDQIPEFILKINFKFPFMDFFSLHHILGFFFTHRVVGKKEFDYVISSCQYSFFSNINIKLIRKIPHSLIVWDPSSWTAKKLFRNRMNFLAYIVFRVLCFFLDKISFFFANSLISSCKFHEKEFLKFNKNIDYVYPCSLNFKIKDVKKNNNILVFDRWDNGNNPIKYLELIKILKKNNSNFKLLIGGTWHINEQKEKFFKKIKSEQIEDNINYLGYLNDNQISSYAAESKYHINLVHEAFGMPSLEVSKYGCLPFVVKNSGVLDILNLPNELIIEKEIPMHKLAERILLLNNDEKFFFEISESLKLNSAVFVWEKYAKDLENIIKKNCNL